MIPPVDAAVLTANPRFAALHKALTTKFLNPEGSTKKNRVQNERDARAPELQRLQVEAAKTRILKNALIELPLTEERREARTTRTSKISSTIETPLPHDITELIILLTLQFTATLSPSETTLLQNSPAYTSLPQHIQTICHHLSTYLKSQALPLTRLLNPSTNASFLHRNIPSLPKSIASLRQSISHDRHALLSARLALTPLALEALKTYTSCTQATIRCLETTKHGLLARHSKTSAELLSLQSQAVNLETKKTSLLARGAVYTPEVRRALRIYGENLRDGRARLGMRKRDAERVLRGYGVYTEKEEQDEEGAQQERTMREIAKVWEEMEKEVEGVRRDIERLRGR